MDLVITKDDLLLIKDLSSRQYTGNSMKSKASETEINDFKAIKTKLKSIAISFKNLYDEYFGEFEVSVSTGNPISYGGTKLNRVWSGIYKGATNKQYAAQISFVINPELDCLDVGFYYGRASSHSLVPKERKIQEDRLKILGNSLVEAINSNDDLKVKFEALFEEGFIPFLRNNRVSSKDWLKQVSYTPHNSHIAYRLYPDEYGFIEFSNVRFYVSMISFLMGLIPNIGSSQINKTVKPLSPEERAKQAERRALTGNKGEIFVMKNEELKLNALNIDSNKFLKRVSLESDHYGYDILSRDANNVEMYIEVKTTTRLKSDPNSSRFFMSCNEYKFSQKNSKQFFLYRVYDINGDSPEFEIINMNNIDMNPDGYVIEKKKQKKTIIF